jgi:hypothetical protein
MILKSRHGTVVWLFANVVGAWMQVRSKVSGESEGNKAAPVPHESILPTRSSYGCFLANDWNTPSAMVDRQMLPRQTKSTET